jgi:hypothetical protein
MPTALASAATIPRRSGAVTAIGVIFLSLGAMWFIGAVLQGAFFAFLNTMRPAGATLPEVARDPNVPVAIRFLMRFAHLFWFLNIGAAALLSVASIGLLRRRNWGRVAFLYVAGGGMLYALGTAALTALFVPFVRSQAGNLAALEVGALFSGIATVVVVIVVVKSILLALFFGWMLRKLASPAIRAEFT